MKIEVSRADNGYILKYRNDNGAISVDVVEEEDSQFGELEACRQMLLIVKEYFGIYYSDHNEINLNIEVKKNENRD